MKKSLLFLPFLLLLVGAFISCEEVEEAGNRSGRLPRVDI